jgi:hypothetical protein
MRSHYQKKILPVLIMKSAFTILQFNFCQLSSSQDLQIGSGISSEKGYNEELYIMTDRDFYVAGEKVWLKIYKINGLNKTPGNISKVVYIELLDPDNNPINQLKIGIEGYSGSSVFRLPDTLRTGNYFIRSYTHWMQNFPEEFFSYKKISVINPFRINEIKIPSLHQDIDSIIFFPEGGKLISGMQGRIGIKSIDKDGEPGSFSGAIINGQNDTLTRIVTGKDGYGWTAINPSGHNNYYLVTRGDNGVIKKFTLPGAEDEGISVSVPQKNEKSTAFVKIRISRNFTPADSNIFLVMNTAGLTGFKKKIGICKGNEITLLRKDMPPGLSELVVIDGQETILAQRWVYNETVQPVNYNITLPDKPYSLREKIRIDITATDSRGNPLESDFSVSVAKAVTLSDKSIDSNKFRQLPTLAAINNDKLSEDINNWLIFYNPHDPGADPFGKFKNSDPLFLPEIEGHLISGNIKNRKTGEPLKTENISLSFVGKTALCQFAKTNDKGEFHFNTFEQGLREIVIQPLSDQISDYYVELKNPFSPPIKKYNSGPFIPDTSKLAEINSVIISSQINNMYEPYTPASGKHPAISAKPNFYGKPDNTILLSKYIELTSLKEVVKEIIPGVSTVRKNDKINFKLYYQSQNPPFENNPLVLVDGVPVYDLEKVLSISSKDLEKIDVFTTRYYISDIVMDGILHFVTKTGNLDVIDLDRSVYRVQYDLPEYQQDFYSPDYSTDNLLNDRIPDFRNTLYWNPGMHTDKRGNASIEFYSSDESAEYTITIEGITGDGKTGAATMPLIINSR